MPDSLTISFRYTIQPGDSFSKLAIQINECAGVTYDAILKANPQFNPVNATAGTDVLIPSAESGKLTMKYTIMANAPLEDFPKALEQSKGITYQEIEAANPGIKANAIRIGEVINVPTTQSDAKAPAPQPKAPETSPNTEGEHIGYWCWTWSPGQPPAGANMGMAFSGWSDIPTALGQSNRVADKLAGDRYITLGGGNQNGAFDAQKLTAVTQAINSGEFAAYQGIAFDVEEGTTGLAADFQSAFAAAKDKGMKVLVTVSHSAPFGIKDAPELMNSFFQDQNIDILSPQLYTTGEETQNDYATSYGVTWNLYAECKAAVAPSIVNASMYASAKSYFAEQGVTLQGFIQWSKIA